MTKYEWISDDDFEEKLVDLVHEEGVNILSIPGVAEILREHFNNDILEALSCESCGEGPRKHHEELCDKCFAEEESEEKDG